MKRDEYATFLQLPETLKIYRAHRPAEADWIAYTLDPKIAARFAVERGVDEIVEYLAPKSEVLALFLRRGEAEILVLDKRKVERSMVIEVVKSSDLVIGTFNPESPS